MKLARHILETSGRLSFVDKIIDAPIFSEAEHSLTRAFKPSRMCPKRFDQMWWEMNATWLAVFCFAHVAKTPTQIQLAISRVRASLGRRPV